MMRAHEQTKNGGFKRPDCARAAAARCCTSQHPSPLPAPPPPRSRARRAPDLRSQQLVGTITGLAGPKDHTHAAQGLAQQAGR